MVTQKPPPKKLPGAAATPSAPASAPAQPAAPVAPAVKKPPPAGASIPARPAPAPAAKPAVPAASKASAPVRSGVAASKPAAKGAAPQIEDAVLELFKDSPAEVPAMFRDFMEKIEPTLALGDTSVALLQDFANIDVTAEKVAQTLRSNQYYQYQFQRVVASLAHRPEPPPLEAAIVLLGMQNSRNLIVSLQMQRAIHRNHPEFDKDGKLRVPPKEVLKYSLKTEEIHVTLKAQYADLGFAAGLVFDYLVALAHKHAADPKKVLPYIDQVFTHCLKSAYLAREIAQQMPSVGFGKFTFAAALLHDIGKAAMAILSIDYLTFVDECFKKELTRPVRLFTEEERFGVNHAMLGALICHSFKIFRPIERVVLHHHEPFIMKEHYRNLHPLTALVCLSSNVANHFKKLDRDDDPIIKIWKGPEISDFAVNTRHIVTAMQRVV